jgi:eukaryotic-like serine/threonine-protein kinase
MPGDADDDSGAVTSDRDATETARPDSAPTEPATRMRLRPPSAPIDMGDRYRLGKVIAKGGMGEIVAAHDVQIGRDVAIKRLLSDAPSPIALARFLREARIQGRLDHPAIVPVHELLYDADARPFFVMKKLGGTTLSDVLRTASDSRQRLLRAFVDVCNAIEFAHRRGVIHRDLKPSNILLGELGEVYVLDWGIARVIGGDEVRDPATPGDSAETRAGTQLGTPGYMSPEQIRGVTDLDGRTDVYALGCILFEILAGLPLHPRGEAGIHSALAGANARPSRHASDPIPPELDSLCVAATALERTERLRSARDLGDAVQRYLDGDRDLEQRARLATEHLAAANAALDKGDDEHHRKVAMREAGQALALDPTLIGAAELVGRLMLEPPLTTPKAVAEELTLIDDRSSRQHAWIGVAVHAFYLSLAVVFAILGMRDGHIAALAAVSIINVISAWLGTKHRTAPLFVVVMLGNVATIALFARMFTPFLIAPGLAAVTLMAFAFHPVAAEIRTLAILTIGGIVTVIGLWALEATDVLAPTMRISDGAIHLLSPIDNIGALPVELSLCLYALTLIVIATILAHNNAVAARSARDHLHIQAWQLRQLISVPVARSGPHAS